jgi:hypothetical protein
MTVDPLPTTSNWLCFNQTVSYKPAGRTKGTVANLQSIQQRCLVYACRWKKRCTHAYESAGYHRINALILTYVLIHLNALLLQMVNYILK